MFFKILWYITLSSSVWNSYFGGLYLFPIFVFLTAFMMIQKGNIKVTKIAKVTFSIFLVMLFYGSLSLYWSLDQSLGLRKLMHLFIGILFLFEFCIIVNRFEKLIKSIHIFSFNYYLVLIISLIESFTGKYVYATHEIQTYHLNSLNLHYPLVMFNNTNDFAVFLLLFIPVILYHTMLLRKFKIIVTISVYLLIAFVIFNTESRMASALVVLVGISVLFYGILYYLKNSRIKVFFCLIIFSFIISFLLIESNFINSVADTILNDSRIILYENAFNSLKDTFTIGVGIGSLYHITSINLHNYILEILIEFGILIFILHLVWFLYLFYSISKIRSNVFSEYLFANLQKLYIIFIPLWGGISSSITSKSLIWVFYAFLIVFVNILNRKQGEYT